MAASTSLQDSVPAHLPTLRPAARPSMAAATAGISRTSEAAAMADPTMDPGYGSQLLAACPPGVDVNVAVDLDPETPKVFHNQYFINLQKGMGLLTSDQVLYADLRSRPIVDNWAANSTDFQQAPSPLASSSPPSRLPLKFSPLLLLPPPKLSPLSAPDTAYSQTVLTRRSPSSSSSASSTSTASNSASQSTRGISWMSDEFRSGQWCAAHVDGEDALLLD